ncbi:MAG: 50S ribosomal protein L3 N(5)-glutamine methyltransferase [Pseudomonadota bacterium]|nr:50S ribosomal protein L3 N(5)-glutamine methyltransferase [Pseudomonadota bacterium]
MVYWAEGRFLGAGLCFAHGTTNSREEAVLLVFHALGLPFDTPEDRLDRRLTEEEKARVVGLLRQRIQTRKPAAYLLGEAWFAGLPFYVNEQVLVPRSPIAELIESGFSPWVGEVHRILDIGTGSGCIAIACALAYPEARVDAVDLCPRALEVARCNVLRHQVRGRVRVLQSDLFAALAAERYDLIVSNPPYVPTRHMATLSAEHRHEPALGLDGGPDGLAIVNRILEGGARYLTENGVLVVEVGESAGALEQRYPRLPFVLLELTRGEDGVFLIEADTLHAHFGHGGRTDGHRQRV